MTTKHKETFLIVMFFIMTGLLAFSLWRWWVCASEADFWKTQATAITEIRK